MMDIETNQTREFSFLDTTGLANRMGISVTFSTLSVGNMMEVAYNPANNELLDLRQSFTRDFPSRTGVRINMDDATITLGNDVLNFTSQTLIMYRDRTAAISDITEDDIISIVAVGDVIWLIQIESGHGFLRLTNASTILNARIILEPLGPGTHRIMPLNDTGETLNLPEGTFRVTVEGTNIENYTTELTIRHGETTTLDLTNVEPATAVLELAVTPRDALVFINDALRQDHREPMEFEFGQTLIIRVEREGYVSHERTVEINQLTTGVNIALQEEVITSLLMILTEPIGADVWVNHIPIGQSPAAAELMPGNHVITLRMLGYYDYTTTVFLHPGESTSTLHMRRIADGHAPPQYTPGQPEYGDSEPDNGDNQGDDD